MYKGVESEANRTESGSPFVFQSECPVTLKGIGVKATQECDSSSPFVFQPECPVTLKGIGTKRSRGPFRGDAASRVVRIPSDGSRRIKPVEVNPLRHAVSCRSFRVSVSHGRTSVLTEKRSQLPGELRQSGVVQHLLTRFIIDRCTRARADRECCK